MSVALCEVGPRDGLQNEPRTLVPEVRAELVERLAACGLPRIEVTSFVDPARVPAMAGAEDVVATVERAPGVVYAGLILNERGYDRLHQALLDEARMVVACTEAFSTANVNATVEQAFSAATSIARRARKDGIRVSLTLAVAFGCPYEGRTPPATVLALAERAQDLELDELVLADTIGVGSPREVASLVRDVARLGTPLGVHFHDTRNTGLANAYAALESGAVALDAAVGGTGGCPFAPGSSGNLATEDVVYALERDGIGTGVDLGRLAAVSAWLEGQLGHALSGRGHRATVPA